MYDRTLNRLCEAPITHGPRKGLPATGSPAGYWRHKRAGELACAECLKSVSAMGSNWNRSHPDERREQRLRWNDAHPEYHYNVELMRQSVRRWRAAHLGVDAVNFARWRKANLPRMAEHQRKRRALQRGAYTLSFSAEQLDAKMSYWGYQCWMCGGSFEAVDHVKPISEGGPHILANLRPACLSCNSAKHNKWPYAVVATYLLTRRAA